ncbi:hypothetical protein RCL1_001485 [Eukaryota sp. TZLM3-RCL]
MVTPSCFSSLNLPPPEVSLPNMKELERWRDNERNRLKAHILEMEVTKLRELESNWTKLSTQKQQEYDAKRRRVESKEKQLQEINKLHSQKKTEADKALLRIRGLTERQSMNETRCAELSVQIVDLQEEIVVLKRKVYDKSLENSLNTEISTLETSIEDTKVEVEDLVLQESKLLSYQQQLTSICNNLADALREDEAYKGLVEDFDDIRQFLQSFLMDEELSARKSDISVDY